MVVKTDIDEVTPQHTIRVASELTGVPIETLRVWERRYGFPAPSRRDGSNRRLYTHQDVERLRWVARALDRGFRPGDVVTKDVSALEALLGAPERVRPRAVASLAGVADLLAMARRDDVAALEQELRRLAGSLGPRRFVSDIAHPLAVAVGDAWAQGTLEVRQEHVVSECLITQIRQMLSTLQDVVGTPVVLLATLPGEPHSLGLIMVALMLALAGARPRLLGPDLPAEQVRAAAEAMHADVVAIGLTPAADAVRARAEIAWLARELPRKVPLWLGGAGAVALGVNAPGVTIVPTWDALDAAVKAWRAGQGAGR